VSNPTDDEVPQSLNRVLATPIGERAVDLEHGDMTKKILQSPWDLKCSECGEVIETGDLFWHYYEDDAWKILCVKKCRPDTSHI